MSKGALKEMASTPTADFNVMIKNMPDSEKPELLRYLQNKLSQMEELY